MLLFLHNKMYWYVWPGFLVVLLISSVKRQVYPVYSTFVREFKLDVGVGDCHVHATPWQCLVSTGASARGGPEDHASPRTDGASPDKYTQHSNLKMCCSDIGRNSVRRVSLPAALPAMFCLVTNYQNYTIAITHLICVCLSQCGDGQGRCEGEVVGRNLLWLCRLCHDRGKAEAPH